MKNFYEALSAIIPADQIASKGGLSYLSAATAMSLAGRPTAEFVNFGDKPYLELLKGALVAIDLPIPGTEITQRMYLPVMDRDNKAMDIAAVTVEDINSNRQRALVKAIATVFGDGMSLYLGHDGAGDKAAKRLGVSPETDLATVTPIVATLKEGDQPYVEWNVGVAVCRITDPTFNWNVVEWNGLPYREVLGGMLVDVTTVYRGRALTLSLPVLDGAFNPIPVDKATTFDWNKTVMRALTKCIAFNTGYGLSIYADISDEQKKAKKDAKAPAKAETKAAAPAPAPKEAKAEAPAPAPAPVEPQAEAQAPAPAAEVKAEAPAPAPAPAAAEAGSVAESVERFKGVMQSRRTQNGVAGMMTLFEALKLSTKFPEEHKPACSAALVTALAGLAEGQDSTDLVNNLKTYGAMANVPADAIDLVAGRIVKSYLAAALADGDDFLKAAPAVLASAGVVKAAADVARIAEAAGVPVETRDLLAALTEAA